MSHCGEPRTCLARKDSLPRRTDQQTAQRARSGGENSVTLNVSRMIAPHSGFGRATEAQFDRPECAIIHRKLRSCCNLPRIPHTCAPKPREKGAVKQSEPWSTSPSTGLVRQAKPSARIDLCKSYLESSVADHELSVGAS
jgi:hypothetical protein